MKVCCFCKREVSGGYNVEFKRKHDSATYFKHVECCFHNNEYDKIKRIARDLKQNKIIRAHLRFLLGKK